MLAQLTRYFQEARIARGLTIAQLARLVGYKNVSKGCNRIRRFESDGTIDRELLEKLAGILEIKENTIQELAERDLRDFLERWAQWADEPIRPFLVIKMIPAAYARKPLPDNVVTQEDAEAWAASVAARSGQRCCLVWSRRVSCWFTEDGSLSHRSEAVPGEPNMPYMQLPANRRRFLFGETLGSLNLVEWPEKPAFLDAFPGRSKVEDDS